jgi:tetratricopeptide (TPR) repeat protein
MRTKEPNNRQLQREAYLSLIKAGDALVAQGSIPGALATYRQSLDIIRGLVAGEPDNAVLQHNMYVSLTKIGETLLAQGDHPGALAAYHESLEVVRHLAFNEPTNTQWQADVVLSLWRLASAGDDPRGRWTDALAILTRLKSQNQLSPEQEGWIDDIEGEIAKLPPERQP